MSREEMILEHDRLVELVNANDRREPQFETLNQIAILECLLLAGEAA